MQGAFAIAGNFPYNISSQILFRVLDWRDRVPECVGMFQKEVADRLRAQPGTKAWGPLSIHVRRTCDVRRLAVLAPGCFWPRPRVQSAMVAIEPVRRAPADPDGYATTIKHLFASRRKQLGATVDRGLLEAAGIDPTRRAETLSMEELGRLVDALAR